MTILFSLYIANDKINKINAFPTESFIRIPLLLQTLKWNYVTFLLLKKKDVSNVVLTFVQPIEIILCHVSKKIHDSRK
jgi:hypothetical protein